MVVAWGQQQSEDTPRVEPVPSWQYLSIKAREALMDEVFFAISLVPKSSQKQGVSEGPLLPR
jgi:hypothetical protein